MCSGEPARLCEAQIILQENAQFLRQTQVDAYPLLPVLLSGPVITGEGGIGISEGFYRRHRNYSEYKLRDILASKLGLGVVRISGKPH